jgi:hypothetical protein
MILLTYIVGVLAVLIGSVTGNYYVGNIFFDSILFPP